MNKLDKIENLPKDALFSIAIELDLPDLLALCGSHERIDELICKKNDIWYYKLNQEFPELKYSGKDPKEYYAKSKEIIKNHADWKKILPLIDIEKYEFKQRDSPKGKVYALLQSLKKEVLIKIINDYNQESKIIKTKIKKIRPIKVLSFLEDTGLVYDAEFIAYYKKLIKELETYIKNPNYTFDYSLWEDLF